MLTSIISALHREQAGRSNGAGGTADDRRCDWVMVLPLQTDGSTTLSVTGIAHGADPAMEQACAVSYSNASQFGPFALIAPQEE